MNAKSATLDKKATRNSSILKFFSTRLHGEPILQTGSLKNKNRYNLHEYIAHGLFAACLFVVLSTCSATSHASMDETWEPFAYDDFEARGGRVVSLPYKSEQEPPFGSHDVVKVDIINNTKKSICVANPVTYDDASFGIPGAAFIGSDKKDWFSPFAFDLFDLFHVRWDTATVKIKSGARQEFKLSPFFATNIPPPGNYEVFFHIFAPYCRAIKGKRLSYPPSYAFEELFHTHEFREMQANGLPPASERRLKFRRLKDGDYVSIESVPGILFKVRVPIEIKADDLQR